MKYIFVSVLLAEMRNSQEVFFGLHVFSLSLCDTVVSFHSLKKTCRIKRLERIAPPMSACAVCILGCSSSVTASSMPSALSCLCATSWRSNTTWWSRWVSLPPSLSYRLYLSLSWRLRSPPQCDNGGRKYFTMDDGLTLFIDLLQLVEFHQINKGILPVCLKHPCICVQVWGVRPPRMETMSVDWTVPERCSLWDSHSWDLRADNETYCAPTLSLVFLIISTPSPDRGQGFMFN